MSHLAAVQLPDFGIEDHLPEISLEEYEARLCATAAAMEREKLDVLLVYADREHSATMAFLTGVEPRFEESILMLDRRGKRTILLGNECAAYAPDPALHIETILYQQLSLPGQPRDRSRRLADILADFGMGAGTNVGTVGWKYYNADAFDEPQYAIEIPGFLVDLLRDLTGGKQHVRNATAMFHNPANGLRVTNSADQIARFEFASMRTSRSVLEILRHLRAGVRECDLEPLLQGAGLPNSCHPMIMTGESLRRGLASPGERRLAMGDPFVVAYGIWGALTCRAGMIARGPDDLNPDTRDFFPRYAGNYFDVVVEWYERVRIGAKGGEVFDAVNRRRDDTLFTFACNPGHLIHLDEWVHSPFAPGDQTVLRSGMALQMDIIPVSRGPFCYCNAEDGIVLADAALREQIAARYPATWNRIRARRAFMRDSIGIELDESVLPLSNTPAWMPPWLLDSQRVLIKG